MRDRAWLASVVLVRISAAGLAGLPACSASSDESGSGEPLYAFTLLAPLPYEKIDSVEAAPSSSSSATWFCSA